MDFRPKDNPQALAAFYGDPGKNAVEQHIVRVYPPFPFYYGNKRMPYLRFHKKAAPALERALKKIWDYYGNDIAKIAAAKVNKTAGTHAHRKIAGSNKWSNHAYAAGIDINAEENGFGKGQGTIPKPVVAAFKSEGFAWGGDYKGRTDPMHFEWCDRGEPVRTFEQWLAIYNCAPPKHVAAKPVVSKTVKTVAAGTAATGAAVGAAVVPTEAPVVPVVETPIVPPVATEVATEASSTLGEISPVIDILSMFGSHGAQIALIATAAVIVGAIIYAYWKRRQS